MINVDYWRYKKRLQVVETFKLHVCVLKQARANDIMSLQMPKKVKPRRVTWGDSEAASAPHDHDGDGDRREGD